MLVLGLLLAVAALVVFGYMLFGTRDLQPLQIDLGVFTVELTPMHLYLLGAATLVVLVLGLFFLSLGLRAQRRRRREVKELRAAVRQGDTTPSPTHAGQTLEPRNRQPQATAGPAQRTASTGPGTDPSAADQPSADLDTTASDDRNVSRGPGGPAGGTRPGQDHDVSLPSDYPRGRLGPDDRA